MKLKLKQETEIQKTVHLFPDKLVRAVCKEGRWYFSAVDILTHCGLPYHYRLRNRFLSSEFIDTKFQSRKTRFISSAGLFCLIPQRPSFWRARRALAMLIVNNPDQVQPKKEEGAEEEQ